MYPRTDLALVANTSLKLKRGGMGLWFERLRRAAKQFTWRWKSKCLVNKCLLGRP